MLSHPTLEAEADDVITGLEPSYQASVRVDWNKDGSYDHPLSDLSEFLVDVTVDRSLKGSAPEELLLIEGAAAAELMFTVTGDYQGASLVSVLSPFNPDSPFYGKQIMGAEVTVEIGPVTDLGVAYYPQFVGQVRTIDPDRVEDAVTITALDRVEKLRKPVPLAPFAMSERNVSYGKDDSQLIHSHWVIDHCLRYCDTSPTPYRPNYRSETGLPPDSAEGPQFFISGNGSYVPTLGWLDNINASAFPTGEVDDPMYSQNGPLHPDAPADAPTPLAFASQGGTSISEPLPFDQSDRGVTRYWIADRDTQYVTHFIGFTLNGSEHEAVAQHNVIEVTTGGLIELWVQIDSGSIRGLVRNQNTSTTDLVSDWVTIPTGVDHVDCFVQWDNSPASGGRMYVQAGGNDNGGMVSYGSEVPPGSYDQIQGRVSVAQALSLSDVFYASRNYINASPNRDEAIRPAKYAAALDLGLNRFTHTPTRQDDAWDIISEVASAEFGSVFWDERGRFRFWNYQHVLDLQNGAPVRLIDLDDVTGLKVSNTLDSVRNIYTAKLTRKRSKGIVRVYESQDEWEFYVPAQTEKKFTLWLDDVLSPLTFLMAKHTDTVGSGAWNQWTDDVDHGYCVQYLVGGVWAKDDGRPQVDIYVYYTADGYLTVRIWNGTTDPIRLADGSDRPAFRLGGTKVLDTYDGLPITVQNQDSIDAYDYHNLELKGDWYQDALSQYSLIDLLLNRTTEPIPATDAIEVTGDVRVQLGDCVEVLDPEGLGALNLQVYGINRKWGLDGGLSDRYTVEVIRPPGVGIWDHPIYGLWGSTFVWSA